MVNTKYPWWSVIRAEAGKFLGVREIFARILPNFPQKNSKKDDHKKSSLRNFVKVIRNFSHISRDFVLILKDFARVFNKSKLLGVRLHNPSPTPVWSAAANDFSFSDFYFVNCFVLQKHYFVPKEVILLRS